MRFFSKLAVVLLVASSAARAQSVASVSPEAPDRSLKVLRENEDWSFLADPAKRQDFWDPLKYIRFREGRDDWFLTIGGEAREVWQQIGNDNWGEDPFWNSYFNERYMLHFDAHFGKHLRAFVELKSGINSFRIGGPRPIDEKKLDFQAAFLEIGNTWGESSVALRAGRLELQYGSGRLVDVREGPNVRLSFTGFLLTSRIKGWQVDGFAARPDSDNPGFFDNAPDHAVGFWGVYATRTLAHNTFLDLYYIGLDRKQATFERGTAQEVRQSLGARVSRPIAMQRPGWDFDYEALWQFGTFGSAGIQAWTVASETGYRIPTVQFKPRLSLKADISSGDHPNTNNLGTFNALFPKGNYFGVLTSTGPGPANFIDFHPKFDAALPRGVTIFLDWIVQWRESLDDGVYAVPGSLIRAAGGSRARFVGHRPGIEIRWQKTRHLWFQADYGIFYAGKFLNETQPGRNLNYWALYAGYKF
jgi:Alginate export